MGMLELFLVALGLSMDACAVSISNGLCFKNSGRRQLAVTALAFGLAQAIMPLLGFFAGQVFSDAISFLDHWVALILLGIIGGKMIWEAIGEMRHPEVCDTGRVLTGKLLFVQAVATSIDALAVGIGFAVMQVQILPAVGLIGLTTFGCSLLGGFVGKRFGMVLKNKAELLGGIILVAIGVKIFLEHTLGL